MTGKKKYDIGYGKPPASGRFRKGRSGNPKGRPKASLNFRTDVREVLKGKVTVTENGRTRRVSSQKATLMRLREKALRGDQRSMEKLIELAQVQAVEDMSRQAERSLSASEEDILDRYGEDLLMTQRGVGRADVDAEDVSDET